MAERPKGPKFLDIILLVDKKVTFDLKTAETTDELQSRLRREEAEAEYKLRTQVRISCIPSSSL
jgi:hypothetical protein